MFWSAQRRHAPVQPLLLIAAPPPEPPSRLQHREQIGSGFPESSASDSITKSPPRHLNHGLQSECTESTDTRSNDDKGFALSSRGVNLPQDDALLQRCPCSTSSCFHGVSETRWQCVVPRCTCSTFDTVMSDARSQCEVLPLTGTGFGKKSWMSFLGKNVDTSWKQTCECFFKGMDSLQILCPSNPMWKNTFQKQFKRGVIYPWPIMCNVHSQSCPAQSISLWCPKALKATVLTTVAMKSCSSAGAMLQALKQDIFAMLTQCWLACLCWVPRSF